MMNTPICDFVENYISSNPVRVHMPGHKGVGKIERFDLTEIVGADVLYDPHGIILESQQNATEIFGSKKTVYSVEGSSLSIRAMLYLVRLFAKKPKILAARNAHKVFISAAALLGIDVEWIFPKSGNYISCDLTADELDNLLSTSSEKPTAVYLTSPDYLGNILDIGGISAVCKKHGVLLLVDNAHGAYLNFLPENQHPISLGADLCCDSAHKTLNCLTGCGYLHIGKNAPDLFANEIERAMTAFASTSPSYLLLQSLDKANAYLDSKYKSELVTKCKQIATVKNTLSSVGYEFIGNEPLKMTFCAKKYGYTGDELARILESENVFCEFFDPDFLVMMFTPQSGDDIQKVCDILLKIPKKTEISSVAPSMAKPLLAVNPTDAIFSISESVAVDECVGRVLADASVSCPPAIPIVSCGEQIEKDATYVLKYYGIDRLNVIK